MANDFSTNPYYIDTAFTTGDVLHRNHRVQSIVWTNQVAAGDQLTILDGAGKTIVNSKAIGANQDGNFNFVNGWFFGIQVPTLASGVLQIYIK